MQDFSPPKVVDAALGTAAITLWPVVTVTKGIARAVAPLRRAVLSPPIIDQRLHPSHAVDMLANRGRQARLKVGRDLKRLVAAAVSAVVVEVLNTVDINAIVREHVDVEQLIDINAFIRRLDVDGIVDQIDIATIVKGLDIDAIAGEIDLNRIVSRLDFDGIVAKVNFNAIIDRVDLVGIAENVIDSIDLPELIRESTGSMASEVLRGVRIQGIEADETFGYVVDRLLRRKRARLTDAPGEPESLGGSSKVES